MRNHDSQMVRPLGHSRCWTTRAQDVTKISGACQSRYCLVGGDCDVRLERAYVRVRCVRPYWRLRVRWTATREHKTKAQSTGADARMQK